MQFWDQYQKTHLLTDISHILQFQFYPLSRWDLALFPSSELRLGRRVILIRLLWILIVLTCTGWKVAEGLRLPTRVTGIAFKKCIWLALSFLSPTDLTPLQPRKCPHWEPAWVLEYLLTVLLSVVLHNPQFILWLSQTLCYERLFC